VEARRLPTKVAADVTVRVPKKAKLRDRDFTPNEASMILSASLIPAGGKVAAEYVLARRWIPWLCAYTGARVNEISQLRKQDVQEHEGIWAILITLRQGR
jgi:integrase